MSTTRMTARLVSRAKTLLTKLLPLKDDWSLLNAAELVYAIQAECRSCSDEKRRGGLEDLNMSLQKWFVQARKSQPSTTILGNLFRKYHFNQREQEILIVLILKKTGLLSTHTHMNINDISDLQGFLSRSSGDRFRILQLLQSNSKLVKSFLIEVERDSCIGFPSVNISPELVQAIVAKKDSFDTAWSVTTEEELYSKLNILVNLYKDRSEWAISGMDIDELGHGNNGQNIERQERFLQATLDRNPTWKLNKQLAGLRKYEKRIFLLLLGKELGHIANIDVFTGKGLAGAVSESHHEVSRSLQLLKRNGKLRKKKIIKPFYISNLAQEDDAILFETEFELDDDILKELKIKTQRKHEIQSRKAMVKMNQLVLHKDVQESIQIALSQITNQDKLFRQWGLGKSIRYGNAVTLLFYGPPGVGKTACAEAVASELDQPILVADYSKLQNCYVGETEKNISKIFYIAQREKAVLFWDEADAMFYDREWARNSWEVRNVNVLLQELEKFEGVCILSTNRKVSLDKALARRITMRLEFKPPTTSMAAAIIRKMLPKTMLLDKNIDYEKLVTDGLTGGQIKNIILNASRKAVCRSCDAKVSMDDFVWAMDKERKDEVDGNHLPIGFHVR